MPATMHYETPYSKKKNLNELTQAVQIDLDKFFQNVDGDPANLYHMVMLEIERPLIESVMKNTRYNQSKSAELLGLNRGTFRKKLALYGML